MKPLKWEPNRFLRGRNNVKRGENLSFTAVQYNLYRIHQENLLPDGSYLLGLKNIIIYSRGVTELYYGVHHYPYTSSIRDTSSIRREKRNSENTEQILIKSINMARELQRRIISIDERFERIEKMLQERMQKG